jgi:hypothetical protein
MKPYLPTGEARQVVTRARVDSVRSKFTDGVMNEKGDARSRKLKVVCEGCNTGWMSDLQTLTKPVLLPLLLGERKNLSQRKQTVLATWESMFAMVYESSSTEYPKEKAITELQRQTFKKEKMPPKNWMVWIAPFSDNCCPAINMAFGTLRNNGWPVFSGDNIDACRCHITVSGAGKIAFLAWGAGDDYCFEQFFQFVTMFVAQAGFTQIWPTINPSVRVDDRRTSPLTFRDMIVFRDAFGRAIMNSDAAGKA